MTRRVTIAVLLLGIMLAVGPIPQENAPRSSIAALVGTAVQLAANVYQQVHGFHWPGFGNGGWYPTDQRRVIPTVDG